MDFVRTGTEKYIRLDGTETFLAVWQGKCRTCGDHFEVKTPMPDENGKVKSNAFGRVMCDLHKAKRGK